MSFRNLLRNKGLVFAVSALVALFLLFLLLVSVIQANSVDYIKHVNTVGNILSASDAGLYNGKLNAFEADVKKLAVNGDIEGDSLKSYNVLLSSIAKQKAPGAVDSSAQIKRNLISLADGLTADRDKKTSLSKYIVIAAAILSIIFLILVIFPLISRLAKQEDTVTEVKKETEGIMNTVNEGLFLLTTDNEFGIEQSVSLREMFRSERDLEGNFFDFIANYVPQSTIQVAKDYLELLYGERVKEKLVKDLNPLNEVEINIPRRDGSFENRYLDFKFSRVMIDNKLSHLLGSVTDVTREVLLNKQLEESKEEQEAQMDLLLSILHIDNNQLQSFLKIADTTLLSINEELEAKGHSDGEIRAKLKEISENAHRLKGDAAALGLHKFEFSVHALESAIEEVQVKQSSISGKDLLPLVTQLKLLFNELQNMRGLVSKFSNNFSDDSNASNEVDVASGAILATPSFARSELEAPLYNMVDTLCERTNKRASLVTYGLDDDSSIPQALSEVMISSSVQFIRNSIVHGSLMPEERLAKQKSDFLNIVVSVTRTDEGYTLVVRDDGEGLNEPMIIARAVELGILNQNDADELEPGAAARFIFNAGFSTQEEVGMDAGRGIGLNAVYSMVRKAGGIISLRHKQGSYCHFQAFFAHADDSVSV